MPTFLVPKPGDRPDVLVDVDGAWLPGKLRKWVQADDRVVVGSGPVATRGNEQSQPVGIVASSAR